MANMDNFNYGGFAPQGQVQMPQATMPMPSGAPGAPQYLPPSPQPMNPYQQVTGDPRELLGMKNLVLKQTRQIEESIGAPAGSIGGNKEIMQMLFQAMQGIMAEGNAQPVSQKEQWFNAVANVLSKMAGGYAASINQNQDTPGRWESAGGNGWQQWRPGKEYGSSHHMTTGLLTGLASAGPEIGKVLDQRRDDQASRRKDAVALATLINARSSLTREESRKVAEKATGTRLDENAARAEEGLEIRKDYLNLAQQAAADLKAGKVVTAKAAEKKADATKKKEEAEAKLKEEAKWRKIDISIENSFMKRYKVEGAAFLYGSDLTREDIDAAIVFAEGEMREGATLGQAVTAAIKMTKNNLEIKKTIDSIPKAGWSVNEAAISKKLKTLYHDLGTTREELLKELKSRGWKEDNIRSMFADANIPADAEVVETVEAPKAEGLPSDQELKKEFKKMGITTWQAAASYLMMNYGMSDEAATAKAKQ